MILLYYQTYTSTQLKPYRFQHKEEQGNVYICFLKIHGIKITAVITFNTMHPSPQFEENHNQNGCGRRQSAVGGKIIQPRKCMLMPQNSPTKVMQN